MEAAILGAAVVAVAHMAYLVYVALGGFLGLRGGKWLWPHAMAVVWSVSVVVIPLTCPLTWLEKWLLSAGGTAPYQEAFTEHYLRDVVYPAEYETAVWLAMIVLALGSYVLVGATRRRQHGVAPAP